MTGNIFVKHSLCAILVRRKKFLFLRLSRKLSIPLLGILSERPLDPLSLSYGSEKQNLLSEV